MEIKWLVIFLMTLSSYSNATLTNLDVANDYLAWGTNTILLDSRGERIGSTDLQHIIDALLLENSDGTINAKIDFTFESVVYRYEEQGLFYQYQVNALYDTASAGLTKSGFVGLHNTIDIMYGTELLEQLPSGIFAPSGLFVLNLLEHTCLSICEDEFPALSAANEVPLPAGLLLFSSAILGFAALKRLTQ